MAAIKFSPRRDDNISQVELSFVSIFVLLYHAALFGCIMLAVYVIEKHPPFPPQQRGSFDPDYLVFLVLLLVIYSYMTGTRNVGRSDQKSQHVKEREDPETLIEEDNIGRCNMSLASGVPTLPSRRSDRSHKSENSRHDDASSNQGDRSGHATVSNASRRSGRSSARSRASESSHGSIEDIDLGFHREKSGLLNKLDEQNAHSVSESTISSAGEDRELRDIHLDEEDSKQSSRSSISNRHKGTRRSEAKSRNRKSEFELLNTNQSLEWKGLLSACFLFFQLADANSSHSEVNLFYNASRTGASCFVFLTGFGHATYFYTRNNYRLTRVLKVLFRLNMTCFILCLTMGRPYIYYYACPLHSMAFLMTYGAMRINQDLNYNKFGLRTKLLGLAGIMFLVWDVPLGFFELFFNPFFSRGPPSPGIPNGPLWEWYYHSFLHHWATFVGIIYAINYPITSLFLDKTESQSNRQVTLAKTTISAALAVALFAWASGPFKTTKLAFDSTQAYFSFLPILSYVYFRNMTQHLRQRHMSLLKALGTISLEIFLLHNHLFLSDNGNSMLVVLPGHPKCNVLITGMLLIYTAQLVNKLTSVLSGMLLPSENNNRCLRSLGVLAGCTVGCYGLAYVLQSMELLNLATVGLAIVILGVLAYQTIMDLTWQEYRNVGKQLIQLSTAPEAESSVAKATPPLIGLVIVLVLGFSWQIMSIQSAFGSTLPLPESCEIFANDGAWTPVHSCNEYQRGVDTRDYEVGAYYRDCSESSTLHWGWRKTNSNTRCNFYSRSSDTLHKLLDGRNIIFIGDSMVRNLFHALCRALGDSKAGNFDASLADHSDIAKMIGNTRVEYKWAPLALDQVTKLKDVRSKAASKDQADLIIAGGGTLDRLHVWATDEDQESQKVTVQKLAKELDFASSPTIWCTPTTVNTPALGNDEKRTQMNELAIQQVRTMYADLDVERSANFVLDGPSYSRGRVSESFDGLNYPHGIYDAGIQILVNALDWLLPVDDENEYNNASSPPATGSMSNLFLGLMMVCFCMIGLFFFDGYFGFSYLSSLFVRKKKLRRYATDTKSVAVLPNDLYEEAFIPFHQKLKLPLPKGVHTLQAASMKPQEEPRPSSFQETDILSLLGNDLYLGAGVGRGSTQTASRRK